MPEQRGLRQLLSECLAKNPAADVAFSPDGRFLAAGDTIGNVSLWTVATGRFVASLSDPVGKGVIGVAFSPRGDALAVTDTAGDAYVWNAKWLGS